MDAFIGTVLIWAPTFAPLNWSYCNGALIAISQNAALFSLIGTSYGGDGQTTFGLPDLRSRVPIGAGMGQGPGLSFYTLGATGGVEDVTLNTLEMPQHTHGGTGLEVVAHDTTATSQTPVPGGVLANANFGSGISATPVQSYAALQGPPVQLANGSVAGQTSIAGGSQPHENRMPFEGLSFIICLFGIFPPRQ